MEKADREIYESALLESATELTGLVQDGDVVYLHGPQTAGLVPHIKSTGVSVVWRCHVGLDHPNELAREAWSFLSSYVEEADAYIFSRKAFAWEGLDEKKLWLVAPSIDAFSPKNQDLGPEVVQAIMPGLGLPRKAVGCRPSIVRTELGRGWTVVPPRSGAPNPVGCSIDRPGISLGSSQGSSGRPQVLRPELQLPHGPPAARGPLGGGGCR